MFNPLGTFDIAKDLNPSALEAAKALVSQLPDVPAGSLDRIYNHWTVGHYNQNFDHYNVSVRYDGSHFHLDITHDLHDNARGVNNNAPAPHTYRRNTGAVGVTVDAMAGASVHNFGAEPITALMMEYLCAVNAAVAHKYGIDLAGTSGTAPYAGEPALLTHAEAADRIGHPPQYDPYGPGSTAERWDITSLVSLPSGVSLSAAMATTTGDAIRERSRAYKLAIT